MKPLPIQVTNVPVKTFNPRENMRWTPDGLIRLGVDLPNEPLRTYSVYGIRGSQKYPFGPAFTKTWEIEGWDPNNWKWVAVAGLLAWLFYETRS